MSGTGAESAPGPLDPTPEVPSPPPPAGDRWSAITPGYYPPPPPEKPRRGRAGLIAAAVAAVLLLGACLGVGGTVLALRSDDTPAPAGTASDAASRPSSGRNPIAEPSAGEEPVEDGPQASAYPATKRGDLERVCDEDVYYPQSPKRAGKAPHPVVLLVSDTPGLRTQDEGYYYDEGLSNQDKQTWAAPDPRKVQLVACLDQAGKGTKIRSCKFDDPNPDTLALHRSTWRLRVFEAATRRQLLDKRMSGDDQTCPFVTLYGPDKKIYAKVSNRVILDTLRPLVTR
ncbi:hypothetical protein AB0J74_01115 [Asanoa sp. NPDC049573]|uniref:hypothetical protein n=1 Tax=Asanoa sp. NPDC049573 TaxID=3155396 RepID=UPI0034283888